MAAARTLVIGNKNYSYGIPCDGAAAEFVGRVLEDDAVAAWYAASRAEPEVYERQEVG